MDVDDIGEGNDALLCHTNRTDCCRDDKDRMTRRAGEWYFPNQTPLKNRDYNIKANLVSYFFRDREYQVVRLNRINSPPDYGKYFCKVQNTENIEQTIHSNIGMSFNYIHACISITITIGIYC